QVHCEQIGKAAGHADDQRPDAGAAVAQQVSPHDRVGIEYIAGFVAKGHVMTRKGSQGGEFPLQKCEALFFGGADKFLWIEPGGGHELADSLIMPAAVLPDIEACEVKTESIQHANDWSQCMPLQARA